MITRENIPDCVSISAFVDISWGPFYKHGLTLTPAWISNRMPCKVLAEITSLFPNFNDCTIQVWKWISNFIPHFTMDVITYPCCDQCSSMLVKGPLEWGMMSCQEAPFFNRVGISDRHTDAFRHPQTELSTCTCNPLKDEHTFFCALHFCGLYHWPAFIRFMWCVYPYSSGLLHWQWGNHMISSSASEVTLKDMGKITRCHSQKSKLMCAYFMGCTIW